MNYFYSKIDVEGQSVYSDIFGTKDKIYSGSEATEFHLAKMFAFAHILKHDYPIIVDSFRAEDLSTDREDRVLDEFLRLNNHIIFTTTVKKEEGGKYQRSTNIKSINFSEHTTNKMLSELYLEEFKKLIEDLMIIEE